MGPDRMGLRLLRRLTVSIAKSLCFTFERSWETVQVLNDWKRQIHTHLPKRRSGKQQRSQLQVSPRIPYEIGPHRSCCHKHERQVTWEDTTWAGQWQMTDQVIAISDEVTCSVGEGEQRLPPGFISAIQLL